MVEIFNPSKKLSRKVTVEEISKIIYERMREIFEDFVKYRTEKLALLHTAGGGVVISGGVAKLKGIINLAEDIFKVPVTKNLFNLDESFLQPEFASGIGLLILASKQERGDGTKNIWQMIRKLLNRFF